LVLSLQWRLVFFVRCVKPLFFALRDYTMLLKKTWSLNHDAQLLSMRLAFRSRRCIARIPRRTAPTAWEQSIFDHFE